MEDIYGIIFNRIYCGVDAVLYEAIDIKKMRLDTETDYYYDELEYEYVEYDDFEAITIPSNNKFVGKIQTFAQIKQSVPKATDTNKILSAYLENMTSYLYLGKILDIVEDEAEETTNTKFEIIPLNISFLTTLGDDNKIMECIIGSVSSAGRTRYTLEDTTIDRLLNLKTKNELITELRSIKEFGNTVLPDSTSDRQVQIYEEQNETAKSFDVKELYNILTNKIINQESAIKDIVSTLALDEYSTCTAERTRCLLVGPTGCGKSEIIRTIANYLDKPFVHIDSTQLTQPGYVGANIEDFLMTLVHNAKGDISKAEHGILVLDEIDKKGSASNSDVSGRGVLNTLLPLLDGTEYSLKEDLYSKGKNFNTSHLTIFAAGAFTDVIKGKNKVEKSMGFNGQTIKPINNLDLKPEDFIKYGMMTDEFMGRFQVISQLNALDKEILEKILLTSTASPLKAEIKKLKKMGIKLTYEDGYIKAVAEQAILLKTGARSLKSIIEKSIKEARFEVIMNSNIYSSIKLLKESPVDSKAYKLYKKKGR